SIVDLFPTNLQFKYSLQQTKDINKPIIPITKVGNKNILFKTLLYRRSIFQYINNNAQFSTKFFIDNNYLSIGNIGIIERLYNSTSKNIHRYLGCVPYTSGKCLQESQNVFLEIIPI